MIPLIATVAVLVLVAVPSASAVVIKVTGVRAVNGTTILVSRARAADLRVRLFGIRPPDARSCFAPVARSALHEAIAGRRLTITTVGRPAPREIRGYVERGRLDLATYLLQRGLARTDLSARSPRKAAYRRAEARARGLRQGMWGACPSADLSVQLSDTPDPVAVGADLTYRLLIANAGPIGAQRVVVDDDLPKTLDPSRRGMSISVPGRCELDTSTWKVRCMIDRVAPNGSVTITITVRPRTGGLLENVAVVRSAVRDRDPANNSALERTTVVTR